MKVILMWCFVFKVQYPMVSYVWISSPSLHWSSARLYTEYYNVYKGRVTAVQSSRMTAVRETLLCRLRILRVIVCLARWRIVLHFVHQTGKPYFYLKFQLCKVYIWLKSFIGAFFFFMQPRYTCFNFFLMIRLLAF